MTLEYLCWAPDRATFIAAMLEQRLPGDRPICRLPSSGNPIKHGQKK